MPERRVRAVLAVEVERDPIAVVANPSHCIFDVLHCAAGDGIVEDRPGIITVVSKGGLEETAERSPSRADCAQSIVETATPEERDADADLLEAFAR